LKILGVDFDEVSKPLQALLGAIIGTFLAELIGPALVRWEDII